MDQPLRARTFNEVRYYLTVCSCEACGKGPWIIDQAEAPKEPQEVTTVTAHCKSCHATRDFSFTCAHIPPEDEDQCVNPTDSPSQIVDLGQWLGLHALMLDKAEAADSPNEAHQTAYQAGLCLAEALKFYGDDELPDKSVFFSHTSEIAFERHPESFSKQKLRDMLASLPAMHRTHPTGPPEQPDEDREWWQFWKRRHPEG